jgi:hypothetical protein
VVGGVVNNNSNSYYTPNNSIVDNGITRRLWYKLALHSIGKRRT